MPPGQYGDWAPRRAGWCPGLPVPIRRYDIAASVDLTGPNELNYVGSCAGALSESVVYYR